MRYSIRCVSDIAGNVRVGYLAFGAETILDYLREFLLGVWWAGRKRRTERRVQTTKELGMEVAHCVAVGLAHTAHYWYVFLPALDILT